MPDSVPGTRPRVAVLVVGLDPAARSERARLEYLAEQAVARSGRFELVRAVEALDPDGTRERQGAGVEADAALARGQKAYDELDTERAGVLATSAIKLYRQTDLTRRFPALSKAWVLKIASLAANGETRAAQYEIEKLVAVDPRAQFSPNYFSPDVLKQAEDARRVARQGKSKLQVRTVPPGAAVYVNGQFRGLSPLSLPHVAAGEHLVSAVLPGYSLAQVQATAGENELTLRPGSGLPALEQAERDIAADPEGPRRDRAAQSLGRTEGADQVVLLVVKQSAPGRPLESTGLRLFVRDGHNAAYGQRPLSREEGFSEAVDAQVTALLATEEPRTHGPVSHFASHPSEVKSRGSLGYVLLGAGVGLLGGGLLFALQAQSHANQFKATPQVDGVQSQKLERSGRSAALAADLLTLGGLGAVIPGALLTFSSDELTPSGLPPNVRAETSPAGNP